MRPVLAWKLLNYDGKIKAPPSVTVQMVVSEDEFAPSLPRPCHRAHDFSETFQRFKRWQGRQTYAKLRCQGRARPSPTTPGSTTGGAPMSRRAARRATRSHATAWTRLPRPSSSCATSSLRSAPSGWKSPERPPKADRPRCGRPFITKVQADFGARFFAARPLLPRPIFFAIARRASE